MEHIDALTLELEPFPEWDSEDLALADLAEDAEPATKELARDIFKEVIFTLPPTILHSQLNERRERNSPLGSMSADIERFDFHLIEIPLNILIPEGRTLVRLRLELEAVKVAAMDPKELATTDSDPVVAFDLFPTDTWSDEVHQLGELRIDVSTSFTFIFPTLPSAGLGLKLALPLRWSSTHVQVRSSDRLSNPLVWDVKDESITHGFIGYAIWRAPKHSQININALLRGELRTARLKRPVKAQFRAKQLKSYRIGGERK